MPVSHRVILRWDNKIRFLKIDKKIMNTEKTHYSQPVITGVDLDNEISLQLESTPPEGPNETRNLQENYNNAVFTEVVT